MIKTRISAALALALGTAASAQAAITITITEMRFSGAFSATGTMNANGDGSMVATQNFNGHLWTADQQNWFDTHTGTLTWSDTGTPANTSDAFGDFSYTFQLTGNQVAAGTWFDWNGNNNIPVLTIYTCDTLPLTDPLTCKGVSLPMATPPFPGAAPKFNGNSFNIAKPVAEDDPDEAMLLTAGSLIIDVRNNDTDLEDGTPTGTVTEGTAVAGTAGGSIVINGDNTITYTPATLGTDTFGYFVADSNGEVSATEATVTVIVTAAPVSYAADFTTTAGVDKIINIVTSTADTTGGPGGVVADDGDGDALTYVLVSDPLATTLGGSVTGSGSAELTYTPPANTNTQGSADDTFDFQVNDGANDSNISTMSITVDNADPVADPDSALVFPNTPIDIDVLTGDTDIEDGAPLPAGAVTGVTATTNGALAAAMPTINGDGTIRYQSGNLVEGVDTFDYTLTDSNGGTTTATVTVTVSSVGNIRPVTVDVDFNTDAGTPKIIDFTSTDDTGGDLVATDDDGDPLTFVTVQSPTALGGTVDKGAGDTELTYTPKAGFNGLDTFTFNVNDGKQDSTPLNSTMSITVNNVLPVANNDPGLSMLLQDGTLNIDVVANDSDLEDDINGDVLDVVTVSTDPGNGTAVEVAPADGTIDFTPAAVGTETFQYTVTDSNTGVSTPATVTITVTAAPVTNNVGFGTNEDVALTTITLPDATIATDADGDALTFTNVQATADNGGTVTGDGTATLTYTPLADFNGDDTFTFSVNDGTNDSAGTSTMTITVAPVDDPMTCNNIAPVVSPDVATILSNNELIGHCSDIDGTLVLEGTITQPTGAGSVLVNNLDGTLTYTPGSGVTNDSFTYTVTDGVDENKVITAILTVDDAAANAIHNVTGNFTMLAGDSTLMGGGATVLTGVFDERLICDSVSCSDIAFTTTLSSPQKFFDNLWTAHEIRVFSPGTYTFDTDCSGTQITAGTTSCAESDGVEGPDITITVGPGQLGAHMLFDWTTTKDIDVAVLWDYNSAFGKPIYDGCIPSVPAGDCDPSHTETKVWNWASLDGDGNGTRGVAMVDGPFAGSHANFNLDMTPGYTPPVAKDDNVGVKPESISSVIDVIANDEDAEQGKPPTGITVALVTAVPDTSEQGGTLVNVGDGTVEYTPPVDLIEGDTDSFQYTLTDKGGAVSNTATVTITITSNIAPVANDVELNTNEDTVLTIDVTDVDDMGIVVATDEESNPLTFATFDAATTQGGEVTVDEATNTILTYTPLADFNGTDEFTFTVNDGVSDSNVATVTLTVNPVNDAVVCPDVSLGTSVNEPLAIVAADLIAGCTDVEGDTVSFVGVEQPPIEEGSTVVDDGAGTLTYTPATDFEGDDSFTFTATDGNGGSATATVNIKVGTPFGNFTMLDSAGNVFGGTNDIFATWDETTFNTDEADANFGVMTIATTKPQPFFSFFWVAHHIRVFGPGSYSFDTSCTMAQYDSGTTSCGGSNPITMTVGADQIGAHIIFDWGKPTTDTPCGVANCDIDVVNVWNKNAAWDRLGKTGTANRMFLGAAGVAPDEAVEWLLVSSDVNGDGFNGSPMVDGPFNGFYANYSMLAILPPGSVPGAVADVDVEPVQHSQKDTALGDNKFASLSLNVLGLLALMLTMLGMRNIRKK